MGGAEVVYCACGEGCREAQAWSMPNVRVYGVGGVDLRLLTR